MTTCHFCKTEATHETLDEMIQEIPVCNECCGGCPGQIYCGHKD